MVAVIENQLEDVVAELAKKPGHEAVRVRLWKLLTDELGADGRDVVFEKNVRSLEVRGRIDALLGRTVFEIKSNLADERIDAEKQLTDYLKERENATGVRYVGVATDGLAWRAYELREGHLVSLSEMKTDRQAPETLIHWLGGVVALQADLPTDALTLRAELGRESVAFLRAESDLKRAWEAARADPAAALKQDLWRGLLKLVYGKDIEADDLWLQHTYLVILSKAIACLVMGASIDDPRRVMNGETLGKAGFDGAVESDFFDWILDAPGGPALVDRIARHVSRFRLRSVKTDILKILYETLIDRDQRHGLGEYYTPDWLAAKIVREAVNDPLHQRVMDPSCGSGTFIFHAVRRYLDAAEAAGVPLDERAAGAAERVAGLDIHPVAAIIARVTFLLALGEAATRRKTPLRVPIYIGDAMQLSAEGELIEDLVIIVPSSDGNADHQDMLRFPKGVCDSSELLDAVVKLMHESSLRGGAAQQFKSRSAKLGVHEADLDAIEKTYQRYDALRRAGRDTIWPYVARNLSKPLFLSSPQRKADVLVGNPPWVSFRYMETGLQDRYRELAKKENIHAGGKLATQNDLSALFVARSLKFYLKEGGRFAFVMPLAALTRGQFQKFRSGDFGSVKAQFDASWVLDDDVSPLFPVPSCVIFGKSHPTLSRPAPEDARRFSGKLPYRDADEETADAMLSVNGEGLAPAKADFSKGSPYRTRFKQGATLVPRFLCLVERTVKHKGVRVPEPYVHSRRSVQEKKPWRDLKILEGAAEVVFLRPVLLGQSIAPFRLLEACEGVIPVDEDDAVLGSQALGDRGWSGVCYWMEDAEKVWNDHGEGKMKLVDRWNYHNSLANQFPIAPIRVVYSKAGTLPAAMVVEDARAVIDHTLYWMPASSLAEANYLAAVLNSETARAKIERLQSRGQWGARHFDKVFWTLPIPRFDPKNPLHKKLAAASEEAHRVAAALSIPESVKFQKARTLVRKALADAGVSERVDRLVAQLLASSH